MSETPNSPGKWDHRGAWIFRGLATLLLALSVNANITTFTILHTRAER